MSLSRSQDGSITDNIPAQDNVVEQVRRFNKALLVAQSLSGLLPGIDLTYLSQVREVLEVASGPGGWMLEMARTHPNMHLTGLQTNASMIKHARTLANEQHVTNLSGHG